MPTEIRNIAATNYFLFALEAEQHPWQHSSSTTYLSHNYRVQHADKQVATPTSDSYAEATMITAAKDRTLVRTSFIYCIM
jgi:hypothetical protein